MCKSAARVLFATVSVVFVCCVCVGVLHFARLVRLLRARARDNRRLPPQPFSRPSSLSQQRAAAGHYLITFVSCGVSSSVCPVVYRPRGALVIGRRTDFYRQWRWVDRNGYNRERLMRPMNHLPIRQTYHPPLHHSYSANAVCCAIITEHFVRSHSHEQPTVRALPAECSKPLAVPQI